MVGDRSQICTYYFRPLPNNCLMLLLSLNQSELDQIRNVLLLLLLLGIRRVLILIIPEVDQQQGINFLLFRLLLLLLLGHVHVGAGVGGLRVLATTEAAALLHSDRLLLRSQLLQHWRLTLVESWRLPKLWMWCRRRSGAAGDADALRLSAIEVVIGFEAFLTGTAERVRKIIFGFIRFLLGCAIVKTLPALHLHR